MQDKRTWTDKEVKHAWGDLERMLADEMPVQATKNGRKPWQLAMMLLLSFVTGLLVMFMFLHEPTIEDTNSKELIPVKTAQTAQALSMLSIDRFSQEDIALRKEVAKEFVVKSQAANASVALGSNNNKEQVSQHIRANHSNKHSQAKEITAKPLVQGSTVDHTDSQTQYEKTTSNDRLDPLEALELNRVEYSNSLNILLAAVPTIRNRVSHVFIDLVNSSNLSKDILGLRVGLGIETKISKNTSWIKGLNYEFGYHQDQFTETRLNDGRTTAPTNPGETTPSKYIQVEVEQFHTTHAFGLMSGLRYKVSPKVSLSSTLGVDYITSVSTHEEWNILSANSREYLTNNDAINNWQFLSNVSTDYAFTPSFSLGLNMEYQFKPLYKEQINIDRAFDLSDALSIGLRSRYIF